MTSDSDPNCSFSPLLELTWTRLREFFREKGAVFWVFVFPLLMAVGLGLAFRDRAPDRPSIALVAQDSGDATERLAQALMDSDKLETQRVDRATAERGLARARFDAAVIFQPGKEPLIRADPMQQKAPFATTIIENVLQGAAGRRDVIGVRNESVRRHGARYIDFLIPGLIGMNLMGSSMWAVGYSLVVARKRRLLRRYAVTPMSRVQFLLSYLLSRTVFLVVELAVLLAFADLVFDARLRGGIVAFAILSVLGASAFAAISLVIGARLDNTESANGWMNFVQLPMWVLSGVFFSYERFPEWLHLPIQVLPLTAIVDALRAVFNDGASLVAVAFPTCVLVAWTLLGVAVAQRTFRWQ
ncbi:MAG: ABC transporter permease [Proteobacteria bacterium]|nr:ABC transporter permease [Pseudomonadota bacterium]